MIDGILTRFRKLISRRAGSINAFSNEIGVPQTTLNSQFKSARGLSSEIILLTLNKYEDVSAEWLLRGKGEMLISENLPAFDGEESEKELDLQAELTKTTCELEEARLQLLRLEAQKDYLQERNDDLVVSNRMLQDELNRYQSTKSKKDII